MTEPPRGVQDKESARPDRRWRDAPYFLAGVGILAIALFLEGAIADARRADVEFVHRHPLVPFAGHALAAATIVIVLFRSGLDVWVAAAERRLHWKAAMLAGVAGLFLAGQPIIAGVVALFLSAAMSTWDWREARK